MKLAIAIPMKPLSQAKSRLRPALDNRARQSLASAMLKTVMQVALKSGEASALGVISADKNLLPEQSLGPFELILESAPTGYNQAVKRAIAWAQSKNCEALLILPSDLPLITPDDISNMARLATLCPRSVVLAPDARFFGTNALLLRPPHILAPAFGPDSARRHRQLAREQHLSTLIYTSPTLSHDIDLPADLAFLPHAPTPPQNNALSSS